MFTFEKGIFSELLTTQSVYVPSNDKHSGNHCDIINKFTQIFCFWYLMFLQKSKVYRSLDNRFCFLKPLIGLVTVDSDMKTTKGANGNLSSNLSINVYIYLHFEMDRSIY